MSTRRSYDHRIKKVDAGIYRISWLVDFYYRDSRLRHPRRIHRSTDEAGALRFAKKHGLELPDRNEVTQ